MRSRPGFGTFQPSGGRVSAVIDVPQAGAEGVLCAIGDWNNGLALFVQDGRLAVALTAGSIVTKVTAADRLPAGRHTAAVDMAAGDGGVELTLACDDAVLGKGVSPVPMPTAGSTAAPPCASASTGGSRSARTTARRSRGPARCTR